MALNHVKFVFHLLFKCFGSHHRSANLFSFVSFHFASRIILHFLCSSVQKSRYTSRVAMDFRKSLRLQFGGVFLVSNIQTWTRWVVNAIAKCNEQSICIKWATGIAIPQRIFTPPDGYIIISRACDCVHLCVCVWAREVLYNWIWCSSAMFLCWMHKTFVSICYWCMYFVLFLSYSLFLCLALSLFLAGFEASTAIFVGIADKCSKDA